MVTHLDDAVGDVVSAWRAAGAWDETLMIFTTDNGGCFPEENAGCNAPLRGGARSCRLSPPPSLSPPPHATLTAALARSRRRHGVARHGAERDS